MPTFDFTAPDGTTHSIDGPEGATREQAFQMLQLKLGGSAPTASQVGYAEDTAKSAGGGMEAGFNHLMALPHDVSRLAHAVSPQSLIDKVKAIPGAQTVYNSLPSSEDVQAAAARAKAAGASPSIIGPAAAIPEAYHDANYQPQTAPGRYAHTLTENAVPGLVAGMSPIAVAGGAIAGQGVEDLTGSKTAGAIANVGGSLAAPLALARATRQAVMPLMGAAQVKAASNAAYADPLIRDTHITPQAAQGIATDMDAALNAARSRFAPAQAPAVHAAIDRLANPGPTVGPAAPVSIEELHGFRKTLGDIGRQTQDFKPTEQAVAAGTAKRVLDRYLDNVPSADVTRGNPIDAVQALRDANGNWRAQSSAQKVGDLIGNAIDQASSQHSGMNVGNVLRQKFLPMLKNDAAKLRSSGYGDDVIDAVRQVTQGDFTTNALRRASNMLGGGGGMMSGLLGLGGAEEGYRHGGVTGALLGATAALPGQALRLAANSRTLKAAQAVQDAMLAKAPANAGIVARNNATSAANSAAISNAVSQGIPNVLLQALALRRYGGN